MKKKICKGDFVLAMNALGDIKSIVELAAARKMCVDWHSRNFTAMIKPFDMVANGSGFDKTIKQDDFNALLHEWFAFFDWLSGEDKYVDLFFAFMQLQDEFINAGSGDFSLGAFIGVYGVFRVALMQCLMSKGLRALGGKSVADELKRIMKRQSKAEYNILAVKAFAGGKPDRNAIIWGLQYPEIAKLVKRSVEKGQREGALKNAIHRVIAWTSITDDKGEKIEIPANSGLTAKDEQRGKYTAIWRRLKKEGIL